MQCLSDSVGKNYRGTMNHTISGKACQAWSTQYPHMHPYDDVGKFPDAVANLGQVSNYCRNPTLGADSTLDVRPWCYTTDSSFFFEKEYCQIPYCRGMIHRGLVILVIIIIFLIISVPVFDILPLINARPVIHFVIHFKVHTGTACCPKTTPAIADCYSKVATPPSRINHFYLFYS